MEFGHTINLDGHSVSLRAKTLPHVWIFRNREIAFSYDPRDGTYRERWRKGRLSYSTWEAIYVDGLLDGSESTEVG